jgi:hypothetical protein
MPQQVQRIIEKVSKNGKTYWSLLVGDIWRTMFEKPQFELGDVIEFESQGDGPNSIITNVRKVAQGSEQSDPPQGLSLGESIALQTCLKAVACAAPTLNVRSTEDFLAAVDQCFVWYLEKVRGTK